MFPRLTSPLENFGLLNGKLCFSLLEFDGGVFLRRVISGVDRYILVWTGALLAVGPFSFALSFGMTLCSSLFGFRLGPPPHFG